MSSLSVLKTLTPDSVLQFTEEIFDAIKRLFVQWSEYNVTKTDLYNKVDNASLKGHYLPVFDENSTLLEADDIDILHHANDYKVIAGLYVDPKKHAVKGLRAPLRTWFYTKADIDDIINPPTDEDDYDKEKNEYAGEISWLHIKFDDLQLNIPLRPKSGGLGDIKLERYYKTKYGYKRASQKHPDDPNSYCWVAGDFEAFMVLDSSNNYQLVKDHNQPDAQVAIFRIFGENGEEKRYSLDGIIYNTHYNKVKPSVITLCEKTYWAMVQHQRDKNPNVLSPDKGSDLHIQEHISPAGRVVLALTIGDIWKYTFSPYILYAGTPANEWYKVSLMQAFEIFDSRIGVSKYVQFLNPIKDEDNEEI